jgi:signal transduction histidine kinase
VERKTGEMALSARLASVGRLAAGVAHEINNPLNIISGYAELGRSWLEGTHDPDRIKESRNALDTIAEEAFRCKRIVEQLASLTGARYEGREEVSLRRVARDVLTLVRGLERFRDRHLALDAGSRADPLVSGSEAKLKQVVLNLVVNALQAVDPGTGRVTVSLEEAGDWARLVVADNGCGLDDEMHEKIFEPFFSRRREGRERGLGLGLTISHGIVEAHGGRLLVESAGPGKGSRFIIELPVCG